MRPPRARGRAPSRSRGGRSRPPSRAGSRPSRGRRRSAWPPRRRPHPPLRPRSAPPSLPMRAASASGTRRIVGESAVIATRASVTVPPATVTTAVAPTTAISICRRYSSRRYALPVPCGGRGNGRSRREARRRLRRSSPGPVQRSSTAISREPDGDRSVAVAPKQTSGPPVSIAGEAFITLPPIVPCARVACEPTIAQASARAVKRARIVVARGDLRVAREGAEPEAPVAGATRRRGARRCGGSRRCSPAGATCPSGRRRRGRCRPRPGVRRPRARRRRRRRCVERRRS